MKNNPPVHTNLLASPAQFLKGIGPTRSAILSKQGIATLGDLLYYVPRRYLDKTSVVTIAQLRKLAAQQGNLQSSLKPSTGVETPVSRFHTILGEVRSFKVIGYRAKARFVVVLGDATGSMQCVWFGGIRYWKTRFRLGELIAVSGEPSYYGGVLQFVHPDVDRIALAESEGGQEGMTIEWTQMLNTGGLVPLYASNNNLERVGLDSAGFRRIIGAALSAHGTSLQEVLPEILLRERKLEPIGKAFRHVHFPRTMAELEAGLARLKYEEFFTFQLMLAIQRRQLKEQTKGISFSIKSMLARKLVDSLPFELTKAQIRVIKEITADMESPKPLNRLLQGDVGSGKTVVALIAMLIAVENGYQAAFMAPTEILAEQHFRTLKSFLGDMEINIRLLVGKQRTRLRKDVLNDVQRGSAQIVVGTHALFEGGVEFAKLGFVVIDEQHRFGVMQKASLRKKGEYPDVLVMTATPIPRTLSLTLYGELDVSVIDELPKGRRAVQTLLKYDRDKEWVYQFVRDQVRSGRQAYFVYPVIEESEKVDLKAATVHFEHLRSVVFPDHRLGLLHGRLSSDEKDEVMDQFKQGRIDILVATTVIEVGIDIPNATLMVIENAERFGLSQLHQLRGRVGRGSEQSYCVLLAGRKQVPGRLLAPTDEARQAELAERRLATMVSTSDGFKIAEVDLQLRGPGDFFGTRQSGIPGFRVANIVTDAAILEQARKDAFALVARDPQLSRTEHQLLAEHIGTIFRDAGSLIRTA